MPCTGYAVLFRLTQPKRGACLGVHICGNNATPSGMPCTSLVLNPLLGLGHTGWPGLLGMTTVAGLLVVLVCCAAMLLALLGAAGEMPGRDWHCYTPTMIVRTGQRRAISLLLALWAASLLLALLAAGSAGCWLLAAGSAAGQMST